MKNCLNPWVSIWTEPRKTISQMMTVHPNQYLWVLASIYGFVALLNAFQAASLGDSLSFVSILIISLVFAPLWGRIVFSVWSRVVYWIGKLFKGRASFIDIRTAFSWACVPLLFSVVLWVVLLFVFGAQLFQHFIEPQQLHGGKAILLFAALAGKVVGTVWSLVIYINTLAEVQKFSVMRSILNILVSWIAIGILLAVFWVSFSFLLNLK